MSKTNYWLFGICWSPITPHHIQIGGLIKYEMYRLFLVFYLLLYDCYVNYSIWKSSYYICLGLYVSNSMKKTIAKEYPFTMLLQYPIGQSLCIQYNKVFCVVVTPVWLWLLQKYKTFPRQFYFDVDNDVSAYSLVPIVYKKHVQYIFLCNFCSETGGRGKNIQNVTARK
jgi:hypothetical protein